MDRRPEHRRLHVGQLLVGRQYAGADKAAPLLLDLVMDGSAAIQ
jgi:hypothetical protein